MRYEALKMRTSTACVMTLVLLSFLISPSFAQQNHTLQWGVDENETFIYVLQRKVMSGISDDDLRPALPFIIDLDVGHKAIMTVVGLDTIPELIAGPEGIPKAYCTLVRENDSFTLVENYSLFVLPVGDWNFLTEMETNSSHLPHTFIDTNEEWGFIINYIVSGEQPVNLYQEIRYDKENGTLSYLRFKADSNGHTLLDILFVRWYPGIPTVLSDEFPLSTVLTIGVALALGALVAILVYIRMKSKKPLVQLLGE